MDKKLVIFDFDGVLTDSYDVCISVSRNFFSDLTDESYKVLFTGNIYEAIDEGKEAKLTVKQVDHNLYFEIYEPLILEIPPREGFAEIIKELYKKEIKIAFVSSCFNKPLTNYLKKYNLINYVDEILGGDVERSKEKKFIKIFNDFKINPSDAVFITDTLGDLLEAERVELDSIAVSFGFHDKSTLEKGKNIAIVDTVDNLKKMLLEGESPSSVEIS